jgi:hypothetical protein
MQKQLRTKSKSENLFSIRMSEEKGVEGKSEMTVPIDKVPMEVTNIIDKGIYNIY